MQAARGKESVRQLATRELTVLPETSPHCSCVSADTAAKLCRQLVREPRCSCSLRLGMRPLQCLCVTQSTNHEPQLILSAYSPSEHCSCNDLTRHLSVTVKLTPRWRWYSTWRIRLRRLSAPYHGPGLTHGSIFWARLPARSGFRSATCRGGACPAPLPAGDGERACRSLKPVTRPHSGPSTQCCRIVASGSPHALAGVMH